MLQSKRTYPFETVWHGHVEAFGLFFPVHDSYGTNLMPRIMRWWQPEMRLYEVPLGMVALFPQSMHVNCDMIDGWALCKQGQGLASVPLPKKESQALQAHEVVILMHGQLHRFSLQAYPLVSPADWVCLDEWQVATVEKSVEEVSSLDFRPAILDAQSVSKLFHVGPAPQDLQDIEKASSRRKQCAGGTFFIPGWIKNALLKWGNWYKQGDAEKINEKQAQDSDSTGVSEFEGRFARLWHGMWRIIGWGACLFIVVELVKRSSSGGWHAIIFKAGFLLIVILWGVIRLLRGSGGDSPSADGWHQEKGTMAGGRSWFSSFRARLAQIFGFKKNSATGYNQASPAKKPMNDAIMRSMLGKMLQRRQTKYMRQMLKMFENQDYENALRYAIPISKDGSAQESVASTLGVPDPRQEISMSLAQRYSGGYSIYTSSDVQQYLRDIYRRSFERLDRQGNIDHAAFVLVELLNEIHEAADYLEKHDRLEQAAQVAEAHGREPALAICLWLKLNNLERAMQIARMNDAFGEAIRLLEKRGEQSSANDLRLEYAALLEQNGDYELAISQLDTMVRHPEFQAHEWMQRLLDLGVQQGGEAAARVFAKWVLWYPQEEELILQTYRKLLGKENARCIVLRKEFLQELFATKATYKVHLSPLGQRLAKQSLRYLLQDRQVVPELNIPRDEIKRWFYALERSAFTVDRAKVKGVQQAKANNQLPNYPISIEVNTSQGLRIYDAGFAMKNAYVLALGEAGVDVVRVDEKGKRVLRHFNCAAHRLVISDNGMRALALAELGASYYTKAQGCKRYKVYVLELDTGKSRIYGVLDLVDFTPTFSGLHWITWSGTNLQIFDMQQLKPSLIWSVGDFKAQHFAGVYRQNNNKFSALFLRSNPAEDGILKDKRMKRVLPLEFELWRYSGNGARLEERSLYYAKALGAGMRIFSTTSRTVLFTQHEDNPFAGDFQYLNSSKEKFFHYQHEVLGIPGHEMKSYNLKLIDLFLMEAVNTDRSSIFRLYSNWTSEKKEMKIEVLFANATALNWRISDKTVAGAIIWDDLGRVVALNHIDDQEPYEFIQFSA